MVQHTASHATDAPHVALLIETSKTFGRSLLLGISRYSRTHGPWSIYFDEFGPDSKLPRWLKTWKGDGIITRTRNRAMAESILSLGVPVVDTLNQVSGLDVSGVYTDDGLIARAAAEHLLSQRIQHFAYVGVERASWSTRRGNAFVETLRQAGFDCHVYSPISRRRFAESWEGGQEDLADWLKELPKPVGLLAGHDMRAMCVFDACRRGEISVPEQVAIVGVDNDDVICNMSDPPLTSIPHRGEQIGYEAAALLARLMAGKVKKPESIMIPPLSLVVRRSTDIVAIDDPLMATALKLIRNCHGDISVDELAQRLGLSRRAMERKFSETISVAPHDQIIAERLQRLKMLLQDTDFSLEAIALQMKMSSAAYVSTFFKKLTGRTPGEFRSECRLATPGDGFYPVETV
ncbi:XylR family transcriptional regulator [Planctomicrobium sp. SH664]|uniref:XylR family transcriptional regulator n=1 Tax=Planctomicrobium sp. SH664 TaxID=3448125 RepID=UPI003F5C83EB